MEAFTRTRVKSCGLSAGFHSFTLDFLEVCKKQVLKSRGADRGAEAL